MKYFIILTSIFFTSTLIAENKDFFKKNYVHETLKDNKQNDKINKTSGFTKPPKQIQQEIQSVNPIDQEESVIPGEKVKWVSLVVNSMQEKHFYTELTDFLALVKRKDFDIAEVICVGVADYENPEVQKLGVQVIAYGGQFKYAKTPPEQYQITESPALIVATEKGIHILEAFSNFDRYFNARGHFIS